MLSKNNPHQLQPGAIRAQRPKKGQSQAHDGVTPLNPITHRNVGYQPLPKALGLPPYHYALADHFQDIAEHVTKAGKMVFHVLADSGGVKDSTFQSDVAEMMADEIEAGGADAPQYCYHVGDLVYFTGARADYYSQFYEAYAHYSPPIFAIPGNHDGEVDDASAQTSLEGFVSYFMQANPDVDPISLDAQRVGLNLPNVYWTLMTEFATIVGMYTNVPEGGSVDSVQQQWVTNEFSTADPNLPLILALHHPIYSFDEFHSGSAKMADILENAIRDTGRVPNLVMSGHVHDYQLIEQTIHPDEPTPFLVAGMGGYHNLHRIHSDKGDVDPKRGSKLVDFSDTQWGYITLTIDKDKISGVPHLVDKSGNRTNGTAFSYSAKPLFLAEPKSVPTL